eukprot:3445469-Amphidinium_carterae.1
MSCLSFQQAVVADPAGNGQQIIPSANSVGLRPSIRQKRPCCMAKVDKRLLLLPSLVLDIRPSHLNGVAYEADLEQGLEGVQGAIRILREYYSS